MGSNNEDAVGRQMTYGTPPPSQISQMLNVSTNTAEAIHKAATDAKK